jgi:hypothetical protein
MSSAPSFNFSLLLMFAAPICQQRRLYESFASLSGYHLQQIEVALLFESGLLQLRKSET